MTIRHSNILAIVFSLLCSTLANAQTTYTLVVTDSDSAVLKTATDNKVQAALICEGGFQAESVVSLNCSSGRSADDPGASVRFSTSNLLSPVEDAILLVNNGEGDQTLTLHCEVGPDLNNPFHQAKCK